MALVRVAALAAGLVCAGTSASLDRENPSPSASRRAEAIVEQMTGAEKLSMAHGGLGAPWGGEPKPAGAIGSAGFVPGAPQLGIPPLQETDAELGIANPGNIRPGDEATAMPANLALASTWDVRLARRQGEAVGREARAKGFNVLLGGAADLIRDPRGGRDFEYFSEDPWLTGVMAGAQIAGVQSRGLISTIKHFALNDQETGRVVLDARIDRGAARESDLLAFEIAIEQGRPLSVMCAYNQVNSAYSCENDWLLNQVLKTDWRYPGFVMSDWGAVHSTVGSVLAGLDQESGEQLDTSNFLGAALADAVAEGRVPAARLDDMVRRILYAIFTSGVADARAASEPLDFSPQDQTALDIEREGAVLLQNRGVLPLSDQPSRILVVGGHADRGVLSGGGSSQVIPRGGVAFKQFTAGRRAAWIFDPSAPLDALRHELPASTIEFIDGSRPDVAAEMAARANVVIVFACQWKSETIDVPDLGLPENQDELIAAIADANPRTVVVLETGGPVKMPWLNQVGAVLEAWYPGQQGARAIADLLVGKINPSGHLPVTFPWSEAQLPHPGLPGAGAALPLGPVGRGGHYGPAFPVDYSEGAAVGYKWFEERRERPLFPFGFGLSYTGFKLTGLRLSNTDGGPRAEVRLRNVGARAGTAVAQLYLTGSDAGRLPMRLLGWTRTDLQPSEERSVRISIDPRLLASFDEAARVWRIPAGNYEFGVGLDVRQLDLTASLALRDGVLPP
jgi:beta-glucosidase